MKPKRIRRIILLGILCLSVALTMAVYLPIPPYGRFSTPDVANEADAFFEFSNGKAMTVVFGGEHGREGPEDRHVFGDYHKENGKWICVTHDGTIFQLHTTLLSLNMVDSKGHKSGPYYRYEIYTGR